MGMRQGLRVSFVLTLNVVLLEENAILKDSIIIFDDSEGLKSLVL